MICDFFPPLIDSTRRRRSVGVRGLQTVTDLPQRREIEPLLRDRWPAHVAREPFQLLPLLGLHSDARV